ncbi:SDR family oxidoreductase [Phycicoccus sp. CSK15P-2]|uniref:SDR family NAD(P)-dependent oxidoreductase n=1 Tax=Phycicoccus sp. CSK15P-2 TaxID=2807627 RepID=UPI0019500D8F|nr:SDR family oxidoreductase [Phycicoccus sp. CSK15P-2]MBM6405891.1 SDR family oxidoreductase [Phycicoccus sp. CSK15P-2]
MTGGHGAGAVVTGAAHGIGRAIATKLVAEGLRVVVADVDAEALGEVAAETGAFAVAGDVASPDGVGALVAAARDRLGDVDVWFGNAGIDRGDGLDSTEDDWHAAHEVNVMAHVRAARLLVPRWVERGSGRYVVTASAAGLLTMLGSPTYSVTKHGAVAVAEWLSATYRHRGVVVQAVCPQGVQTRMLENASGLQGLLSRDAARTPEEVADLAFEALSHDRFLVLPHPEVGGYYAARATDPDRWLAGMNRLQRKLEDAGVLAGPGFGASVSEGSSR